MNVKWATIRGVENKNPWQGVSQGGKYVGVRLADIDNPSQQWVLTEVDQENTTAGWKTSCPARPSTAPIATPSISTATWARSPSAAKSAPRRPSSSSPSPFPLRQLLQHQPSLRT